jgi:hypothetical protein
MAQIEKWKVGATPWGEARRALSPKEPQTFGNGKHLEVLKQFFACLHNGLKSGWTIRDSSREGCFLASIVATVLQTT